MILRTQRTCYIASTTSTCPLVCTRNIPECHTYFKKMIDKNVTVR